MILLWCSFPNYIYFLPFPFQDHWWWGVRTCPTPATNLPTITVEAECYLWMQGVQTEVTSDAGGGKNVGYIDTGDWMSYPAVTIPSTGVYRVEYRVARGFSGSGNLQLEKAGGTPVYGSISIPATGVS